MNNNKKCIRRIPVKEGLWSEARTAGESTHLVAHKCLSCGEVFFPKKDNGICTFCYSTDLNQISLSTKGKVHTYTVVMMRPPGGYYHGDVPYALGVVELEDGVYVDTLFTGCDPETIRVGMPVELTIDELHTDSEGNSVMAYKFRPTTP